VPDARKFAQLGYSDALARRLAVMDSTALTLCMENELPIIVFDLAGERGIERVVAGERIGTLVCSRESILAGDGQQVA
jgi:uridylate kinase